jgi:uncharacterized protein YecE (DUF72 family)
MVMWHVGTMGFGYKQWQGVFYPEKLPARARLAFYAERFSAVEMDSTFYGTPAAATVERWRLDTPAGFRICPKAPREITHDLRLSHAGGLLDHFLDTMRLLGEKLGPVLLQFPPDYTAAERENLASFLGGLPHDVRFAVEFRHRSWLGEATAGLLRAHAAAWVAADYSYLPKEVWPTTDFVYLRFLGRHGRYVDKTREQEDKTADLQRWVAQVNALEQVPGTGYAFFNNDYAGYSPATANRFKALVGQETAELRPPTQGRLF